MANELPAPQLPVYFTEPTPSAVFEAAQALVNACTKWPTTSFDPALNRPDQAQATPAQNEHATICIVAKNPAMVAEREIFGMIEGSAATLGLLVAAWVTWKVLRAIGSGVQNGRAYAQMLKKT